MRSPSPASRAKRAGRAGTAGPAGRAGRAGRPRQAGSVTAEFATVIPAVLLVLVFCLGGVRLATEHLVLQDAAADAARTVARGEGLADATERTRRMFPQATASREDSGDLICVTLQSPAALSGLLRSTTLTASSCALAGGR